MEYLLYAVMFILLGYVIYRNITLIKAYRDNKGYIECYQSMLKDEEDSYEKINTYIDSQKSEEGKNKGRLLKLYCELKEGHDYSRNLADLDLNEIFYDKGKLSKRKLNVNSDVFVWIYESLAIARKNSKFDVLYSLSEKLKGLNLSNRLEVKEAEAIYNAVSENDISGVDFLNDILQGNYIDYEYDKNLIGIFKRFAAATLAYCAEPIEDYYKEDLRSFASTLVGQAYMKNLEILDKYPPKSSQSEEDNKE